MAQNNQETPNFASEAAAADSTLDLRLYWRTIVRRRWLIVGVFLTVAGLFGAYTLRLPKVYSASATIIIDMSSPKVLGTGQVQDVVDSAPGSYWFSKEYYETQYNVLRSRAVAARVAERVLTQRDDEFLGREQSVPGEAWANGLKALAALRERVKAANDPSIVMMGRVAVEPVKDSRVAKLQVEDGDPVLAAALANAFAQSYMEQTIASKSTTTTEATESLESRLPDLEAKLLGSARALEEFKEKNDIVAPSYEDKVKMVDDRMLKLNEELTRIVVSKAQLKARNDAITSMRQVAGNDEVARTALVSETYAPLIQQLRIRFMDAKNECDDMEQRMLPQNPKLLACKSKLQNATVALNTEVETVLRRAQAEYNNVAQIEKNLLRELNDSKAEAQAVRKHESGYSKLKRAHDTNVRLYEVAQKSLKETGLSGITRMSNITWLDQARPVLKATKPNVRLNMLLGALAGLVLGFALAFVVEFLDNTVTSQQQIEERLGLTFLGILPSISEEKQGTSPRPELICYEQPKSAVAECCRAIRTNLLFMSPDRPLKSILVTSAGPRDGKTTTAASLAITMAESGNRVLLVDADLRRPRVHSVFKVSNGAGLSSLIVGEGTLPETVKDSGVPSLDLLTCGPVPPNPAELLHTEKFRELLAEMGKRYDRVIIDSPPVGAVADAVVVSTLVDGTVMVLKAGNTGRDMARRTVRALNDVNARVFGAVLNDINLQDRHAGGYYYYTKYGYYYSEPETKPRPQGQT